MMLKMDINKPLYICNHILCIVNYQQDGMTSRVLQSYEECPVSYAMLREAYLEHQEIPCMFAYRQCIHYVSSWIFAKRQKKKVNSLWRRKLVWMAVIPGVILNMWVRWKNRRH